MKNYELFSICTALLEILKEWLLLDKNLSLIHEKIKKLIVHISCIPKLLLGII